MLTVYGVTYDHTTNYGSCLQAYALQTAIEQVTIRGENCSYYLIPLRAFRDYPELRGKSIVIKVLFRLFRRFQRAQFSKFENKFMHYVSCESFNDLPLLNKTADAFVCGSDVIWRPKYNAGIGAYFLDFATKYKFSYAASFGQSEFSVEEMNYNRKYLPLLDAVSVRENTSLKIAQQCTEKKVQIVMDPVLLLNAAEWNVVAAPSKDSKGYIFVYSTHLNSTFKGFIEKLKKITGLDIVLSAWGTKNLLKQGLTQVQSPEQWLRLLRDADFVITNSFHGTVFSVLYHKNFFTVVAGDKAKGPNMRMNDFLKTVGLSDRLFSSVPENIDTSELNFKMADEKIALLRKDSLAYLQENLENAYKRKKELKQPEHT